jgi:DNA adenine methylase Dam
MRIKSPIFYMGNKYDLLDELLAYFPKKEEVDTFIDLFGGSGVVSINAPYDKITYNEINHNITNLLKMLVETPPKEIINHIKHRVIEFDLPQTGVEKKDNGYSKYKRNYLNYRKFYNKQKEKNYLDLYTLTYFSFSNLIRFNSKNEFNVPYGHRCFLNEVHEYNIERFYNVMSKKLVSIKNEDAFKILENIKENKRQFIYLDPPYTNTMAIYNESRAFGGWNIEHDNKLFKELNRLNELGVKWAMSNVLENKGIKNTHIEEWAIENNYKIIEFHNKEYYALGKGNANTREALIINYVAPFEKLDIFDFMEEELK